ncbi:ribosomal protein S18-alanine N-acetyltransferase [Sebaldella sp. S0638]|uniref:ribosomal protein S18-alanine N-acetyltransferase n=1 Tax=Sebaldella sp. S0638 TaxID=2957809 RepID=UPI00209F100D|nr:ribosomal protein S18-alanine N-acetyltransferase [Sebaldella sp. S0638]MCP1225343.1 ribosomal protein S18-alanine N-acetyltransferase [Sebaldella sp. S0638]
MEVLISEKIKDYDNIIKIHNLYFDNKWQPNDIENMNETENYSFILIKKDEKTVAYLVSYDTTDCIDLFEIAVDSSYQGQGMGTMLLKALFERNRNRDILLEVSEDNEKALLLYKKNNFKEISIRKNYYKNNKSAIIMVRKYDN